jgi:hypothetical protein
MNTTPNSNHSHEKRAPETLLNRIALLNRANVIIDLSVDSMSDDSQVHIPAFAAQHPALPAAVEQMMQRTTFVEQPRVMVGYDQPATPTAVQTYPLPAEQQARIDAIRGQIDNALL